MKTSRLGHLTCTSKVSSSVPPMTTSQFTRDTMDSNSFGENNNEPSRLADSTHETSAWPMSSSTERNPDLAINTRTISAAIMRIFTMSASGEVSTPKRLATSSAMIKTSRPICECPSVSSETRPQTRCLVCLGQTKLQRCPAYLTPMHLENSPRKQVQHNPWVHSDPDGWCRRRRFAHEQPVQPPHGIAERPKRQRPARGCNSLATH